MDAAEHDRALGRLSSDPRQGQRVADMIGNVLDGRDLIVVREHGRVALLGQPPHLGGPLGVGLDTGIETGAARRSLPTALRVVKDRHHRLLRLGFRLIIENMPHTSTEHEVLAVVFQVRHLGTPKPQLSVLLWERAMNPAAWCLVAARWPAAQRRGHDQFNSPSAGREGGPA